MRIRSWVLLGSVLVSLVSIREAWSASAFLGGFPALSDDNSSIPPDTMGAAGPSHLVTMLNSQVRIQTKDGSSLETVSLSAFWTAGTGLTGDPFDPRVLFDVGSGRWIASAGANGDSATSQIWLAVSATSDPTGSWSFFSFPADPAQEVWADFPSLGVNQTWIALTANMFSLVDESFAGAKLWVVDKATVLAGGAPGVTVFPTSFDAEGTFGTFGFALQPALTIGSEPALYLVDTSVFTAQDASLIRLSRITGTGPAPSWAVLAGSPFAGTGLFAVQHDFSFDQVGATQRNVPSTCAGGPNDGATCEVATDCVPDAGGACRRLDTGDARVSATPVFRDGRLWFTHSGGLPSTLPIRTAVLWYEIDPVAGETLGGEPIVQSGIIDGGGGVHHFYPSLAVNAARDVVVGFSRSSTAMFAAAVATTRSDGDPAGTMGPVITLKTGEDGYFKTFGGPFNRWGDFSATVVDPADDTSFWSIQEYAETSVGGGVDDDRWGTWWAHFGEAPPTTTVTSTTSTTTSTLPFVCGAAPRSSCIEAEGGTLEVDERHPGKESLTARWRRLTTGAGPAGFGNPVTGATAYLVCLYGDADALIVELEVDRAGAACGKKPCWKSIKRGAGARYEDGLASASGVRALRLVGNAAGKGRATVQAANNAKKGQTALPAGITTALAGAVHARAQLLSDDAGCFDLIASKIEKADAEVFRAGVP